MVKIIHLSDLHVGHRDMEKRFDHIADQIIQKQKPANDYVIVITGDLVENVGNAFVNYKKANKVIEKLNNEGYKVFVIPGNHDYQEGATSAYLRNRDDFIKEFYGNNNPGSDYYPKLDFVDFQDGNRRGKIAFIGLDSLDAAFGIVLNPKWKRVHREGHWATKENRHGTIAQGELGKAQIERLINSCKGGLIGECEYKVVYLHHHPFEQEHYFNKLDDEKDFKNALRHLQNNNIQIDALLFGHNHAGFSWGSRYGIPRCYDCGTSTRKGNGPQESYRHRIIDLSKGVQNDYDGDFLAGYKFE